MHSHDAFGKYFLGKYQSGLLKMCEFPSDYNSNKMDEYEFANVFIIQSASVIRSGRVSVVAAVPLLLLCGCFSVFL